MLPSPRTLLAATAVVVAGATVVGVVWWLTDRVTALAVYKGLIFMVLGGAQLPLRQQMPVACAAVAAAGLGVLTGGRLWLLCLVVVLACALQALVNQWAVAAAALLPVLPVGYAEAEAGTAGRVVAGVALGAAVVIALARFVPPHTAVEPVPPRLAAWHAAALAVGCVSLVLLNAHTETKHGVWALIAFCLMLFPARTVTRSRVAERVATTLVGALIAAAVAATAPVGVCLVAAALLAVLVVAFAITGRTGATLVALTPTVLLVYGSGRFTRVAQLAGERVLMTMLAALLALVLAAAVPRLSARTPGRVA